MTSHLLFFSARVVSVSCAIEGDTELACRHHTLGMGMPFGGVSFHVNEMLLFSYSDVALPQVWTASSAEYHA